MSWNSPKTWGVGDQGTSADLNIYVRDNLNYLYGDTAWITPTLGNNWQYFGVPYAVPAYRKHGDQVSLKGLVANNTASGWGFNIPMFTLPVNYRPSFNQLWGVLGYIAGAYHWGRVDVLSSGVVDGMAGEAVTPTASSQFLCLDGVEFSILQ